jgi:hypothetical protein
MEIRRITKKKAQVSGLSGSVISLGVAAITLVLVLVILQNMRDLPLLRTGEAGCNATSTVSCVAFNDINSTLTGIGTFGDFWTIIVLAIVAAIVIGIIFGAFGGLTKKR